MATKKSESKSITEMEILKLQRGRATFHILGTSPLIYNAMSHKVIAGLLSPRKKTKVERESSLKHNPPEEFRGSMYTQRTGDTLLCFPAVAFKRALASAALDLGGAKRTQMDRLIWAIGERVPIWGVPSLRMDVVRSADINRTPDVRTRACLERWAATLTVSFMKPTLTEQAVTNLLAAAGLIRGIGDFRQEKGAGNFGQFELVSATNEEYLDLTKNAGRKPQEAAFDSPECYDAESQALLDWWHDDARSRGRLEEVA